MFFYLIFFITFPAEDSYEWRRCGWIEKKLAIGVDKSSSEFICAATGWQQRRRWTRRWRQFCVVSSPLMETSAINERVFRSQVASHVSFREWWAKKLILFFLSPSLFSLKFKNQSFINKALKMPALIGIIINLKCNTIRMHHARLNNE